MSVGEPRTSVRRIVVGISGASAPQLGIACLAALREIGGIETHLVISEGARRTIPLEANLEVDQVEELADACYEPRDLAAPIASGSFRTMGMIVIPCSMRVLAAVATGNSGDLLARAADVTLKERRPLVLVCREAPLSLIHLRNMEAVTLAGATVLPPVLAFYHQPKSVDDVVAQIVGKALDQFDIQHDLYRRWSAAPLEQ
jgi:polyprenyl P-hydroxybenzoate/phenylacrylic acid decarboxylase-like protein